MNDQTLSMCENPARPLLVNMVWPDGATHFLPAQGPGFIDTFWQMEGNEPKTVWRLRDGEITEIARERPAITAHSLARLIPRPAPFQREERYIVVKIKDAAAIDSNDPFNGEHAFRDFLKQWHIPTREALVIEADWPEYEPTWVAIEQRMTGAAPAWNGEGLPPAGTVCELRLVAAGTDWHQATIFFASRNVVVWDWVGEPSANGLCTLYRHAVQMRPIRAAEQIEAEEREKAINEMVEIIRVYRAPLNTPENPKEEARVAAQALYDAKFRQVAP